MLVSLTVGKVDAGVAVLLTEDKRLIEFPSILLPPDIHSGSIVDINVSRNLPAETHSETNFRALQSTILSTFGTQSPSPPELRVRNTTQTSVVLEWSPIQLATASLRSLSLYRNNTKAGVIPRDKLSTKISGLALDTEYLFHLVLRTTAGVYTSERLRVRTHKMTDLRGICVSTGVLPSVLREGLVSAVERVGGKVIPDGNVRIDTTHFVCTEPRGPGWEKAVEMNVPVVVPDWVYGCEREGRLVGVSGYYLDADPKHRQMGPSTQQVQLAQRGLQGQGQGQQQPREQQQQQQQRPSEQDTEQRQGPRIEHTPPTPERGASGRAVDVEDEDDDDEDHEERVAAREREEAGSIAGTTVVEQSEASERHDENDDVTLGGSIRQVTEKGGEDGRRVDDDGGEAGASASADNDGDGFDEVAL